MSVFVIIEAVEVEGLGGGRVVASAFGHVQAASVSDGRAGAGEVQAADVGGLQGAGLRGLRPCPASRVELPTGICRQSSALNRAYNSGWFFFTTAT
jgi:hypothetical protein